jgi:hypothetical protein
MNRQKQMAQLLSHSVGYIALSKSGKSSAILRRVFIFMKMFPRRPAVAKTRDEYRVYPKLSSSKVVQRHVHRLLPNKTVELFWLCVRLSR